VRAQPPADLGDGAAGLGIDPDADLEEVLHPGRDLKRHVHAVDPRLSRQADGVVEQDLRATLGEAACAAAWTEGRAPSLEEAIACALEGSDASPASRVPAASTHEVGDG
jgi:hypothetical protein